MSKHTRPPGPSRWQLLRNLPRVRRDLVEYLRELSQQHGKTVFLPLFCPTYMLNDPEDVKYVLVTNAKNYCKSGALTAGREFFGQGLLSSEPPLHGKQRRLMQPMFHRPAISKFAELMTGAANEQIASWHDGATVDVIHELMQITLTIVGRALFSIDLSHDAAEFGQAFIDAQRLLSRRLQGLPIPLWVPTPTNRSYQAVLRRINGTIADLVASRQGQPEPERPNDLLTMLLSVRYEDGSSMPVQQLRDESATLIGTGHETVANQLTWTWYLLSQYPEVERKLVAEWQAVLGGRAPTLADIPALRYTEMVLAESMRVHPPVWTVDRKTLKDDTLPSGTVLPAGSEVFLVQYIFHRNAKYFPDPERFDPERFDPDKKQDWPNYAYFPFGGGSRGCIGEAFARLEATLVLAAIGQRFQLQLEPGQKIEVEPLITLRPRFGMRMKVQARPPVLNKHAA